MQWDDIKTKFSSYVFDCDGVILDSNYIKSDAFYSSTLSYGKEAADQFVNYHQANGGVTRQVKFEYFCREILKLDKWQQPYFELLEKYGVIVSNELKTAKLIPGVKELLHQLHSNGKNIFVVTGGNELETKSVLFQKDIGHYFSLILGNPTTKHSNMLSLNKNGAFVEKSFYFGDSELDWKLAGDFGLEFLCVYGVSEWRNIPPDIYKTKDFLSPIESNGTKNV